MRTSHFLFLGLLLAQSAHADDVQVPVLADGTVDLEKVLDDFEIVFPTPTNDVQSNEFAGKLLGEAFSGQVIDGHPTQDFSLAVDAPAISEHGNYLIAVFATETICLRNGLAPGLVLWHETKNRNGTAWEVSTSCSSSTN